MNYSNQSIADNAARNIIQRLKAQDSPLVDLIEKSGGMSGMGYMSGFLEDIGAALNNAISAAPQFYINKEQQKADIERAKLIAEQELARAEAEIQREMLLTRQLELQQAQQRQAELANESTRIKSAWNDIQLSGTQKTGLYIAGGLTLLLIGMIAFRKSK